MCHGQVAQLRDHAIELRKLGAEVLIVDPHEVYRVRHMLRNAKDPAGLPVFPVLADAAGAVSALYGVAMQMSIHTERSNRPATFIIDRDGVVRYAKLGVKYSDRPGVETIRSVLEKLGDGKGASRDR